MIISTKTYALALFEVARDEGITLEMFDELESIQGILADKEVQRTLSLTLINESVLEPIWILLENYYSKEMIHFLRILNEANMVREFSRIVSAYQDLLIDHELLMIVDVRSSRELNEKEKESLLNSLKEKYQGRYKVNYEHDSQLIKGMVVSVNNDIYDTSIKGKLDQILSYGGFANE
ncbi:MAG: ATP synthase F1 subunit delta [Erysipelothrix sp.]